MNRTDRRAMRAKARETASKAASQTYDYSNDGRLIRVTDLRAVAVLRRAFEAIIRTGQPVTMEISEAEARAFPRWEDSSAGMAHVLAAWIDRGGCCSYSVRSVAAVDLLTGELHRLASVDLAEAAACKRLAEITAYDGFPAIHQTEGRA